MTETCRICLSHNLVNNFIFDEDNKIYLKILSCLPIKINKDDVLPKKICDVCSCKVDDFYKFCHKSIDSENRLLFSSCNEEAGITNVEHDSKIYQFSSSFLQFHKNGYAVDSLAPSISPKNLVSSCTQTEDETFSVTIKQEPQGNNDNFFDNYDDDNSDREFDKQEENQFEEIKIELSPQVKKVVDKDNEKIASKRKSSRKNKKEKRPIKVKIKKTKSKFRVTPESKSDSDEDVSLVDIIKKDKNLKLNEITSISHGTIVLDVKDIKTELMDVLNDGENNANVNREEWNCCICFFRCFEKEEMLGHYRSHYSTKDMQEFESEQMTSETVQDKNGKPVAMFVCSHCNAKSETKVKHLRHLRSHGLDKPYKCSLCEKTFRSTAEILKHGKNAHKYDNDLQEAKLEGEESGGAGPMRAIKRFMCDLCDETFVYMKYVQIHRNLCHPEAKERQFVNRCLHCGREFAHLNSLRRHLRSHSGERNFLCYICGKSLSSREHLKFHIRIHTGFKPHICKTCGKGFVKKCNLTLHERVHSGEKPHVCSHCGKAFSQRSTLVIHERYHSGARPYVCSLCNKGFVAKGLLSMHLKTSCI